MRATIIVAATLLAGIGATAPASARNGGSNGGSNGYGESYQGDLLKNPRLIEPGGEYSPTRYRAYYGREGYGDRLRAQRGYYGDIRVRPYGY